MSAVKANAAAGVPVSSYVEWVGQYNDMAQTSQHKKDLKPASAYDETTDSAPVDNWWTDPTEATRTVSTATAKATGVTDSGLCVESWVLSPTSVACVRVKGTAYRNMKSSIQTYAQNDANTPW